MRPSSQSPVTPSPSVACRHLSPLQLHPINVDAAQPTISSPAKRAVSEERRRRPANYNLFKSANCKTHAELESCSDDLTPQIGDDDAAQASPLRCSAFANGTSNGKKHSSAIVPSPRRSDYPHALAGSIRATSPARFSSTTLPSSFSPFGSTKRSTSTSAEMVAGSGAAELNSKMNDNKGRRPAAAGSDQMENARPSAEVESPKFPTSQNRWPRSLSILKLYGSGRTRTATNAKKHTPQDLDVSLRQARSTSSSSNEVVVPNTATAAAICSGSPDNPCCSDDVGHGNSSVLRTFARKLNLDGVKQIKETLRRGTRISDLNTGGYDDSSRVPAVRAAAVAAAPEKTTHMYCSSRQSMSKKEESREVVSLMRSKFDVWSSTTSSGASSSSSITSSLLSPRVTSVTGTGGGGAGFSPNWGMKKHRRSQSELLVCGNKNKNNNNNNTCTGGGGAAAAAGTGAGTKQQTTPLALRRSSTSTRWLPPSAAAAWSSTPCPRASTSSDGGITSSISSPSSSSISTNTSNSSRRAGSSTSYAAAWPTFNRNVVQSQHYYSPSSPRGPPLSPTSPTASAAALSPSTKPMSPAFHRTAASTTFLPATSHYAADSRKASRMGLPTFVDVEAVFLHRILHNRLLQWRFANARAEAANSIQCHTGQKLLLDVWARTAEIRRSVTAKRTMLLQARQAKKVGCIVRGQRSLLAVWPSIQQEHNNALSGTVHVLETCVSRIPVDGAVQADIHNVKGVVTSALSLMNVLESSIHHLLAKAEKTTELMSELAQVADRERALLGECRDLLFVASSLEVEERSLRAQLLQREQEADVWGRLIA